MPTPAPQPPGFYADERDVWFPRTSQGYGWGGLLEIFGAFAARRPYFARTIRREPAARWTPGAGAGPSPAAPPLPRSPGPSLPDAAGRPGVPAPGGADPGDFWRWWRLLGGLGGLGGRIVVGGIWRRGEPASGAGRQPGAEGRSEAESPVRRKGKRKGEPETYVPNPAGGLWNWETGEVCYPFDAGRRGGRVVKTDTGQKLVCYPPRDVLEGFPRVPIETKERRFPFPGGTQPGPRPGVTIPASSAELIIGPIIASAVPVPRPAPRRIPRRTRPLPNPARPFPERPTRPTPRPSPSPDRPPPMPLPDPLRRVWPGVEPARAPRAPQPRVPAPQALPGPASPPVTAPVSVPPASSPAPSPRPGQGPLPGPRPASSPAPGPRPGQAPRRIPAPSTMPGPLQQLLRNLIPATTLLHAFPGSAPGLRPKFRFPKPEPRRDLTPTQQPGVSSALQPSPQPQTNRCCACRKPSKRKRKKRECVRSVTRDRKTGRFA